MSTKIEIGYDVRRWVTYEITGDLTPEQVSALEAAEQTEMPTQTRLLLRELLEAERLVPLVSNQEGDALPYELHRGPNIISFWTTPEEGASDE